MTKRPGLFIAALLPLASAAQAEPPTRTPLRVIPVAPSKTVDRVETTRVDFAPGQAMPRHKHTVPVICFVTRGSFRVRIDDVQFTATQGSVTYEPAGAIVEYFGNLSTTSSAQLSCASLAGNADITLNVMLP